MNNEHIIYVSIHIESVCHRKKSWIARASRARAAMKRTQPSDTILEQEFPGEVWDHIISCTQMDTFTIGSVFLLNQTINTYLRENSRKVIKRILAMKLNLLLQDSDTDPFYFCERWKCRKIQFGKPRWRSGPGYCCHKCITKCTGCGGFYQKIIRRDRKYHFECVGYSPQPSDDEESVYSEESE